MPVDAATARTVLDALGMADASATPLGGGFASDAWLVRDGDARSALRIERPDAGYPNTYRAEHAVMDALTSLGAPVPSPIAGSWTTDGYDGPAFSLTTYLAGSPTTNAQLAQRPEAVASFLRLLHGLPADGGATAALVERFGPEVWPIGCRDLQAHPALMDRPELHARIQRHADAVSAVIASGPLVPVHSDLHEENILIDGDRLAFIDFGETFSGVAAWEFASIAYFTSWDIADASLASYTDDAQTLAARRAEASLLGLSFGLSRWRQDRDMALDMDRWDEDFLRRTLGRIETATIGPMEIMGVQIRTIVHDNVAVRCDGCLDVIDATPWRVNLLDIVASESPVAWTERPTINPGPFEFHGDPACVRRWMAGKGYLFCQCGEVREIMRPVAIPGESIRWGLCDGIHRDDHEFVPA